jgi:hypothetical protein
MRTFKVCTQCQVENAGIPNFASLGVARIPDDGVIEVTCDRGHRTFTIIQEAKYEILSELAVTALCDGYYREAVASFASALERLYEYYVDVVCRERKIAPAAFAAMWKPLRKLSERQLGAFSLVYLIEIGSAFPLLADKHVKFRNDVIHAGVIPTFDEAVAYGQAVGDCAAPLITLLHSERYEESRRAEILERLQTRSAKAQKVGARHSTQSIVTPFSFDPISTGFDLEAILKERTKRPDMNQAVAESHVLAALLGGAGG